MPLRSARHLIVVLTCVPLVSVAPSQSHAKSHVTFTVVDSSGAAIPGAYAEILAGSSLIAAAEAGPDGAVSFDLPTGSYELSATSSGFLLTKQTFSVGGTGKQFVVLLLPARQGRQDQMWIDSPVNHLELGVPSLTDISRADAEKASTASLTVSVTDESGSVVPRAAVTIVNEAKQTKVTKDTDENGHAVLSVEPGSYRFSVNVPGFFEWHQQIGVENAISRKIEVKLKVFSCPPGPCMTVGPPQWLNELMPISPPMDSVWVEEQ